MEEVKAYIESGILELYVLGEVSHEEGLQVEAMAAQHPAIRAELAEIERSMELFAGEHEIEPSPAIRDRILNSMLTNLADDNTFRTKAQPVAEAPVISMHAPKNTNFYKYAFAACLALLLLSTVALYNVYNRLQESNGQVVALSTQNQRMTKTVSLQSEQLDVFRGDYKLFKLPGTGKTPKASMMVAWSPVKKNVIINMADLNLPVNDAEHQYQLWAIVDGKPVDLGVFDAKLDSATMMKIMKSVDKPQAFAVTLEKKGGSINPTMANLTVIKTI
ncbi:MAG: anti-sigma factor [Bacteroidota bacterium]